MQNWFQSDKKSKEMSIQKKISEEFKVEIKEHFNDVSGILIVSCIERIV